MSVLEDIQAVLSVLDIPIETGVFSDAAPAKYIVVVPLSDTFDLHADNVPGYGHGCLFTPRAAIRRKRTPL